MIFDAHINRGLLSFAIRSLKVVLEGARRCVARQGEKRMVYLLGPQSLRSDFLTDRTTKFVVVIVSLKQAISDKEDLVEPSAIDSCDLRLCGRQ